MKNIITLKCLPPLLYLMLFSPVICDAQKPELVVQTGQPRINHVAFSPDGKLLATGGRDNTIKLWEVKTGRVLRSSRTTSDGAAHITFSPDGKLLASIGSFDSDFAVTLWNVMTGDKLRKLEGRSMVRAVAFSPDGKILASGHLDKTIKLWDVETGKVIRTLLGRHGYEYGSLRFTRGGETLISGSDIGIGRYGYRTLTSWDLNSGAEIFTITGKTDDAYFVDALSPDVSILAVVFQGRDDLIELRNVSTGKLVRTITSPVKCTSLSFSTDGKFLAAENAGNEIALLDVSSGANLHTITGPPLIRDSFVFSPDAKTIATAHKNGAIKVWDIKSGAEIYSLDAGSGESTSILFSPDGKILVGIADDEKIGLWDATTGKELRPLTRANTNELTASFTSGGKLLVGIGGENAKFWNVESNTGPRVVSTTSVKNNSLAFSPRFEVLAVSGGDGNIKLWNVAAGKELRTLENSLGAGTVEFSPDGKLVAAGFGGGESLIWDVGTGEALRALKSHTRPGSSDDIISLAFSPDAKILAGGSKDGTIKLWDTQTGRQIHNLDAQSWWVLSVAFSHDGRYLASSSREGTVIIWDVYTGRGLRTLEEHESEVPRGQFNYTSAIAFSPDGRILVSANVDATIGIWDVSTGKELTALTGHSNLVYSFAFSPDGKFLASASRDTTLKVWDVDKRQESATLLALNQDDWLVVTPDGLFDGSPAAWNQLLWRFSQDLYDVAPVEVFFNEFYHPDLLADLLAGRRPRAAQDIAKKDRRQPRLELALADGKQSLGTLTTRNLKLKLSLTEALAGNGNPSGSGAQDVRLFRNGLLVKAWHGDVLRGESSTALEASVPVVAGENRLIAYAFNRDNVKSADATITVTGSDTLKRQGTAYILAVGVNQYSNPQYNLRYAVADGQAFASEIERQQGRVGQYERFEVVSLYDQQATKQNILSKVAELSKKVQPEDELVIYFAGHGTAQQNQFYLLPHDLGYTGSRTQLDAAGLRSILAHGISDRELEEALETVDAQQILLVIDACNSGQALDAEEKRRGPMNSKGLAQLAYEKGMYILTAAQSFQAALEASQLGHGLLTYALVDEGLRQAKADDEPKDGEIIGREWLDYAARRVPQMQINEMRRALSRGINLSFREEDRNLKLELRNAQQPRVFYRRELEAQPLIVAKPGTTQSPK
jgi:WD40 repeat protein